MANSGIETSNSLANPVYRAAAVKLLNRRNPIPVRMRPHKGACWANGHFTKGWLTGLTNTHAIVRPAKHKANKASGDNPVERTLEDVHLWKSAIVSGHAPICSLEEFEALFPDYDDSEDDMLLSMTETAMTSTWVIMDKDYRQFYLGVNAPKKGSPFTPDLTKAQQYGKEELNNARKSMGKIRASDRMKAFVSESGPDLLTIKEALEVIRHFREADAAAQEQNLRSSTIAHNQQQAATAAEQSLFLSGKATNPPLIERQQKPHHNGNGQSNGFVLPSRMGSLIGSAPALPLKEARPQLSPLFDLSIPDYQQAVDEVTKAGEDVKAAVAMFSDAQKLLDEALSRQTKATQLLTLATGQQMQMKEHLLTGARMAYEQIVQLATKKEGATEI
jgi:hypothetical protein